MNLTFKIVLDKRYKKGNDTHPLKIRIYSGTTYKEKSIDIFIHEKDWDTTNQLVLQSCKSYNVFNSKIATLKSKVQKLILLSELNEDIVVKPDDIFARLENDKLPPKEKPKSHSIIKYGQQVIKTLTASGKVGNAFAYGCAISKLKAFVKTENFTFEELTYKKLIEFQDSMLADEIKVNSISVYMRTLRAIYNRAIKEEITPAAAYPFTAYRIKNENTVNRTLTLKEIQAILNLDLKPNTPIWHSRNYFLLSFCLIGVNFSDLLTIKGSNIIDGRLVFRRKKTGKIYSIKLQPKAIEILNHYTNVNSAEKDKLLLPVLKQTTDPVKLKKDIWQAIKTCNQYLVKIAKTEGVEISKDISTYYARYTWANIARSKGISKDIISQALGHSYGNATTSIYLDDYDNEIIDQANEKVITAVFK